MIKKPVMIKKPALPKSKIWETRQLISPPQFNAADGKVTYYPVGWVATNGYQSFGLVEGENEWTEDWGLIGYLTGEFDDGVTAVPKDLPADLPPLPIGPNADPNAITAPAVKDTADNNFADAVGVFADEGRRKLDAATTERYALREERQKPKSKRKLKPKG